jgi:clan AA aspartic protease
MGMVEVQMTIANPRETERQTSVTLLVDTGATYSMIPRQALEQIGIEPVERAEFETADGTRIHRDIGEVAFFWNGKIRTSPAIFGEGTDSALLGLVALESLALEVDPFNKQLRPAKLILY